MVRSTEKLGREKGSLLVTGRANGVGEWGESRWSLTYRASGFAFLVALAGKGPQGQSPYPALGLEWRKMDTQVCVCQSYPLRVSCFLKPMLSGWSEQTLDTVASCAPLASGYERRFLAIIWKLPYTSPFCHPNGVFEIASL